MKLISETARSTRGRKFARTLVAGAVCVSIASMFGCSAATPAEGDESFTLGIFENTSTFFAGQATGAFDELNMETTVIDSGPAALPLVKQGALDGIDEAGVAPAVIAQATGVPLKIVWMTSIYLYSFVVTPDITTPQDLVGKNIATIPGSVLEFYLDSYLIENGVDPADVNKVDLPPASMPAALKTGQIDGALVWEPAASAMVDNGGEVLATQEDLSFVLISDDLIERSPETVQGLVCALASTQDDFLADPEPGYEAIATALQLDPVEVESLLPADYVFAAHDVAPRLLAAAEEAASLRGLLTQTGDWLASNDRIPAPLSPADVDAMIDASFAEQVADGGCN